MQSILLVESSLNSETFSAIDLAIKSGLHPVFLTNDIDRYQLVPGAFQALKKAEVRETDTNDAAALASVARSVPPPAGIITLCDFNTVVVAAAARALNLPGARPEAVALARNKAKARERCSAAGLRSPRFALCHTHQQLWAAIGQVGTPCIVKPVVDTASHNVTLCKDHGDAQAAFADILSQTVNARGQETYRGVLLEEYVVGCEVSAELVVIDGAPVFAGLTDKHTSSVPRFIELGHTYPSGLPAEPRAAALAMATAALEAIGYDYGAAHVELMLTTDGPVLIEINARLAGGGIPRLIELATGASLREQVLRQHAGLRTDFSTPTHQAASMRFMTAPPGVVEGRHGMEQASRVAGMMEGEWHVSIGASIANAASNRDRAAHVICCGETSYEASMRSAAALNQLSLTVR